MPWWLYDTVVFLGTNKLFFHHLEPLLINLFTALFKMDSAQSLSNTCKTYLLKIFSQHGNFLNTIYNISLHFISLGDPVIKSASILKKVNVKPRKND